MLKALLNCRNLGLLAIDMTDLPRDLRDKLADRGVCGKGPFYGHKIHLYAVADAAYDTVKLYESFANLGAQLIAAVNLRNNEKLKGGCRGRLVRN